jgi:hypothetical protein
VPRKSSAAKNRGSRKIARAPRAEPIDFARVAENLIGSYARHRMKKRPASVAARAAVNDLVQGAIGIRPFSETEAERKRSSYETRYKTSSNHAKTHEPSKPSGFETDPDPLAEMKRAFEQMGGR